MTGEAGVGVCYGWPEELFWYAFYQLEPFGQEWLQAARICHAATLPYSTSSATEEVWLPLPQLEPTQEEIDAAVEARRQEFVKIAKDYPGAAIVKPKE